jgi:hypothetical protein
MTGDFIGINISGEKEIAAKMELIPIEGYGAGVEEANIYIIDVERLYPPRVEHGESNPYHWTSDKQRKAFFATDGFGGGIPYSRTQTLSRGWKTVGEGHMYDQWDIIATDLIERKDEITRKFEAGVGKWLKKAGLQK